MTREVGLDGMRQPREGVVTQRRDFRARHLFPDGERELCFDCFLKVLTGSVSVKNFQKLGERERGENRVVL